MKIKKLTFINHKTGWNIKDAQFDNTTLLVGASGVGKTQILRALQMLCRIVKGESVDSVEWNIGFSQGDKDYRWEGRFGPDGVNEKISFIPGLPVPIVKENLLEGETELVWRDKTGLKYKGTRTVKLDPCTSAVDLLKEEDDVSPVVDAFKQMYELEKTEDMPKLEVIPSESVTKIQTLDNIKKQRVNSVISNLYLLSMNNLPEYSYISKAFMGIFPLVEEIYFSTMYTNERDIAPVLHIKEKGVHTPISYSNMSLGMRKTLSQITALALAKDGDVILIDEFENGLGVNCIDLLADLVRNPDADVQMIITSHHPYIINTIPTSQWKVVTRNGSDVSIHNASELNIGTHSHHDAFMQLLQTNAYKTGQL